MSETSEAQSPMSLISEQQLAIKGKKDEEMIQIKASNMIHELTDRFKKLVKISAL